MDNHKIGFITPGGLIGLSVSSVLIVLGMLLGGNQLFSSGPLSQRSSGQILGGVDSHAELSRNCKACHPAPWSNQGQTELCLDCHIDINQQLTDDQTLHGAILSTVGLFSCRDCHTDHIGPDGSITTYQGEAFPHDLVGFSLLAHSNLSWTREITCQDCHPTRFQIFDEESCSACHAEIDDLFLRGHFDFYGNSCLACHDGLETINNDYAHDQGNFLLTGSHINADCSDCHQNNNSLSQFSTTSTYCVSCHLAEDVHLAALGEFCGDCHGTSAWKPSLYDHDLSGFPLTLGHSGLECSDCHGAFTFQVLDTRCFSCHQEDDPHQNLFGENCETCHNTSGWDNVAFDHAGPYAEFCTACHLDDSPINHYTGQCSFCHNTSGWLPAFFDHIFPINHGGTQNSCSLCHISSDYSTYTCYGCHEHSQAEIINEHEGISNLANCVRCHPDGLKHDEDDDD